MFVCVQITGQHTDIYNNKHACSFRISVCTKFLYQKYFCAVQPCTKLKLYEELLSENFGNEQRKITVITTNVSYSIHVVILEYMYVNEYQVNAHIV